ncbi:UNVERIFIED_CONTAM: hypothetical protein GTU68_042834 [Idotea baltica]|nr:hypothetical protein [Idotea baltica]
MAKKKKKKESNGQPRILNKNARRNYEIIEKLEAGIVLTGAEVKSVRAGEVQLKESYVKIRGGEAFLVACHISPYVFARGETFDILRDRKLLLHKKQLEKLKNQTVKKGLSIVPLELFFNEKGRAKLNIGVGRGKKLFDKREDIKSRELGREMAREYRGKL